MNQDSLLAAIKEAVKAQRFWVLRPSRGVFQSDVYFLDLDGRLVVVKDFGQRPLWSRWLVCRFLIRREILVLKEFAESGYVPRFYGRVSPDMFAMEFIQGEHPNPRNRNHSPAVFAQVEQFLSLFHGAGYAHNDFRRANILIQHDGTVRFFDFAAALRKPRRCHWLAFPWCKLLDVMQKADRTNLMKMKPDITGEPHSAKERRALKKPRVVRALQFIWSNGVNKPILRRLK